MTTIGPYELLDRIGSGGMAEVWKARRCTDGPSRIVALKLLTGTRAENTQYRELFSSEARVSMLLNHANIVQVFDASCEQGINYIAMEWIEGLDLDRLGAVLRQYERKLDPKLVAFITGELLKALAYAHDFEHEGERLTLIHRDISPHNVMVSVTGEVKLMDFGIARLSSEETSGLHVKGKLRYMPPEQFTGEARRPTVDLFAVGTVVHELLSGRKFRSHALDESHLLRMVTTGEVEPPSWDSSTVPIQLEAIRGGLLTPDRERRIQSARAAFDDLRRWPGYSDARFELESVVRCLNTSEPGNGNGIRHTVALREPEVAPEAESVETVRVARKPPETGVWSSDIGSSLTGKRSFVQGGQRLVLATSGLALVLGGLSIGVWLSAPSDPVRESAQLDKPTEPPPLSQPTHNTAAGPRPSPDPIGPPPPAFPDSEPSTPRAPNVTPEAPPSSSEPRPRVKARRVTVTVSNPDVLWSEVRVGRQTVALDRFGQTRATVRLVPGQYRVALREGVKEPWREVGSVRIPARNCELILRGGKPTLD